MRKRFLLWRGFAVHTRRLTFLLTLIALMLAPIGLASAQSGARVTISALDHSKFPTISFFLEAYDSAGKFIPDLKTSELQVMEDGNPRPVDSITRLRPGLQITVALASAPAFAVRNGDASLFQKLQTALTTWAHKQPSDTPDDFSYATLSGLQIIRSTDPQVWEHTLASFQPDLAADQPALNSLTSALDLATDPNVRPNMHRAILYITPLPSTANLTALTNLAERAAQQQVHIFVWLVGQANAANAEAAKPLLQLVDRTGGSLFVFTGGEPLPDPNEYFDQLRYLYQVRYQSTLSQGGTHHISAHVQRGDVQVASPEQTLELELQAPNPIFLAPPDQINRTAPKTGLFEKPSQNLTPTEQAIRILVEFQDGYQRPLQATRLYVDDKLVAENHAVPFDSFTWKLDDIRQSGTYLLKVEVEDSLGMKRSSIEHPVDVSVAEPKNGLDLSTIPVQRLEVAAGLVFVLLAMLGLFLLRRRPIRPIRRIASQAASSMAGTRPIRRTPTVEKRAAAPSLTQPRPVTPIKAPARLLRIAEDGLLTTEAIPITRAETVFGTDPHRTTCHLEDPSVDEVHARLSRTPAGVYTLFDAGSIAGTWVNYQPVPTTGIVLQQGDILHIGQLAFRFDLTNPPVKRHPQVAPYPRDLL